MTDTQMILKNRKKNMQSEGANSKIPKFLYSSFFSSESLFK